MDDMREPNSPPDATRPPPTSPSSPSSSRLEAGDAGRVTSGDESPLTRYARATAPGAWLTADGWMRLAADLDDAAEEIAPAADVLSLAAYRRAIAQQRRDRAADCRQRAARLTRGAL